jgi:hypothetical protein
MERSVEGRVELREDEERRMRVGLAGGGGCLSGTRESKLTVG